jgi:uncharacterized protein YlxP (DUF503 family)
MFVGQCEIDLHIENCQSLKEKRRIVKSVKEKLRNRFNVAVCEYGDLSLWQRLQLGVLTCSNEKAVVQSTLESILDFLDRTHAVCVLDSHISIQ